jgi:hypothetical protein
MDAELGERPSGVPFDLAGQLTDRFPYGKVSLVCGARYSGKETFLRSVLAGVMSGKKYRAAVFLPAAYLPHFVFRIQCAIGGISRHEVEIGAFSKESQAALKKAATVMSSSGVVFSAFKTMHASDIDLRVRELGKTISAEGHKLDLVVVHSIDTLLEDTPGDRPGDAAGWLAHCAQDTGAAFLCSWCPRGKKLEDDDFGLPDLRRHGFDEDRLGPVFWLHSGSDGNYGRIECLKAWDPSAPFGMSQELLRDAERGCFKPNPGIMPPAVRVSRKAPRK